MSEIESEVQRILRGIKQNYSNDSNNIYQSIQQDLLVYSQGKQEITVDQLRLFFTDRKGDINEEQIKHLLEKIPHDNQGIYLIQSVQQTFNSVSGKYPIINRNVQVQEENKQNNNDNSAKKEQSNDQIKEGGENEMEIENVILIQDDDDEEEEDKTILEDGFESLNQKLGQLKEKHIKKEIDLNDIKNMFPDKKMIKFSELVFFLSSYGVDLKSQEEFYLKQTLLDDEKQDSIFIKDFLEFMNLKDNYIQKQQNQNNNNNQNMNNNNNQLPPPPNLYQQNKNNNNFPIIKPDVNYNNQNQNNRYGIDNNNYYPPPPFPAVPQPNQINNNPNMMIPNHMQQLYNQMYNNLYHPNNNFNNNNNNNNFNNNNQYNNNYQNINNNQQIQQNQILNNQNQKNNNNNNNNNSNNINNYNLNNNNNQINNERKNNYMLNSQCEQFEQTDEQIQGYEEFQLKFYDCQVNNKEYIDTEFPPSEDSIANDKTSKHYYEWRQLGWYRPVGFFKGEEYSMFDKFKSMSQSRIGLGQFITPNDIQQGMLGDCYFLSALSCLAQEPHRILNLFLTRQTNKYGIYCIKICHDGEWKAVVIDDHIPCYHKRPAFTKANGNELWVLLIEKAWAKLFKSYSRIESGHCNQALRDLTGAPTANFMTYESTEVNGYEVQQMNQNLLPILYDALNETNRYLITASNDSADLTKSQADRLGLVTSHAYSIIGFKEITHPQLGKVTLVRLRNPWGKKEWKGDWSDGSPLWTAELKEKLRIKQRQDGIFYMSVEDFYKYFVQITICYYHDFFKYTSQKIHQSDGKHSQYFTMKIKTQGTYYISIIQPDKRNFDKDIHYEIGKSRIFVGQMLNQNGQQHIKYIGSFQKKTREVFVECNLEPGVYVIQSKVSWDLPVSTSYVISSYGVDTTEIKPIQKQYLPPSYIEECFKYHARKNSSLKMHGSLMKCFHLDHKQGYGYYYFQNIANQAYQINITFQQHKGLKFKKPQRVPKIQCIAIPQTECIAIFTIDHQGYALQYTENTSQLF